jgi:hypothetical protein
MKTWTETISPFIRAQKKETDKIFRAYNQEVKKKKITTIAAQNKLWNEKYQAKLDKVEKKHDKIYERVFNNFHKK